MSEEEFKAIIGVLDYLWDKERISYDSLVDEGSKKVHIFNKLRILKKMAYNSVRNLP